MKLGYTTLLTVFIICGKGAATLLGLAGLPVAGDHLWCDRPLRLPGYAYLVTLKVGVTRTDAKENDKQPGDSPERIFKE